MRHALLAAAGGLLLGSGLAALPYAENDPCMVLEEGADWSATLELVPLGTRCGDGGFLGPGTVEWLAWICAATVLVAARAGAAAVALALLGILYQLGGTFAPAAFGALLLGAPLAYALDRRVLAALLVPPLTLVVWFLLDGALGLEAGAVVIAVLVGVAARRG